MGCEQSCLRRPSLAHSINDDIHAEADEKINILTKEQEKKESIKYKLLLLGAGESGKSTLLRNIRRYYGKEFTDQELMATKPHLAQNVIEAMRTLAIYSEILSDQGKETKVKDENEEIRTRVARLSDKQKFTKQHCDDLQTLWMDPGIKKTMEYRHTFQLIDTAEYLFDRMDSYWRDEYTPTFDDMIHSRQRTTGINKIRFEWQDGGYVDEIYEIFDAGGQKSERKKWFHFFDNVAAIIFVVALSGYNQTLWEDSTNNRMREAIGLFRGVVNLDVFKDSHVILFLNKSDLFYKKVPKHSVKKYFKEYHGSDENVDQIIHFFKQQFRHQWKPKTNRTKPEIHFHITCATDTLCVKRMFESTRTIIIKKCLINQGFL
eukprot:570879_1